MKHPGWKRYLASFAALLLPLAAGCTVNISQEIPCQYTKTFTYDLDAAASPLLQVNARDGDVTILGAEGQTTVHVEATACTSAAEVLDEMNLEAFETDEGVLVNVVYPDGAATTRMDLNISAPITATAQVRSGAGAMKVRGIGGTELGTWRRRRRYCGD